MATPSSNTNWREFTEPHGYFRVQLPPQWQVELSDRTFTIVQQGRSWDGQRYLVTLSSPPSEGTVGDLRVTLQVQAFAASPPSSAPGWSALPDGSFIRTYRVSQDQEWLSWSIGSARMHINYDIAAMRGPAYKATDAHVPPALSSAERQRRLALVQRIIDSLEMLPTARRGGR